MVEPFTCSGCHDGDMADFDHFCDALDVEDHEVPHALAAWLGGHLDWDGRYHLNERTTDE